MRRGLLRILAVLLCVCMMFVSTPLEGWAVEKTQDEERTEDASAFSGISKEGNGIDDVEYEEYLKYREERERERECLQQEREEALAKLEPETEIGELNVIDDSRTLDDVPVWDGEIADSFAGGSGTENDPYQISCAEELARAVSYGDYYKYRGSYYVLTSDIYINRAGSSYTHQWNGWNYDFYGTIDGDGYAIWGLRNSPLFGTDSILSGEKYKLYIKNIWIKDAYYDTVEHGVGIVKKATSVENCTIEGEVNADYDGTGVSIYGIVGNAEKVINCVNYMDINVNGDVDIDGICGSAEIITNCNNYGNLKSEGSIAGIVGYVNSIYWYDGENHSENGLVENCNNYADIYAGKNASGIALSIDRGVDFKNCINFGNIEVGNRNDNYSYYGCGIIQKMHMWDLSYSYPQKAEINECKNYGNIIGIGEYTDVAGISNSVMASLEKGQGELEILNCENQGNISGSGECAGIVGEATAFFGNELIINDCRNRGNITAEALCNGHSYTRAGGIVGVAIADTDTYSPTKNELNAYPVSVLIINCYNVGTVIAGNVSGGIVAGTYAVEYDGPCEVNYAIENCCNAGKILENKDYSRPGGIVGFGESIQIKNCYNTGYLFGRGASAVGHYYYGNHWNERRASVENFYNIGIIASSNNDRVWAVVDDEELLSVKNIYSLSSATPIRQSKDWLTLLTETQMRQQSSFKGFDFDNVWEMGTGDYPYPVLKTINYNFTKSSYQKPEATDSSWHTPYLPSVSVLTRERALVVVDGETGDPIENVSVQLGQEEHVTDAKGVVKFTGIALSSSEKLHMEKKGYNTVDKSFSIQFGRMKIVPMYSTAGKPKVMEATAQTHDKTIDILGKSLHIGGNSDIEGTSRNLTISIVTTGTPIKYQLIQDNKVIKESDTGTFIFSAVEKDEDYFVKDFKPGYRVYVRVYGKPGEVSKQTALGLAVFDAPQLETRKGLKQAAGKSKFSIGEKVGFTVANDVPIFGGTEVGLGLDDKWPVTVEIEESGKVRVAVNPPKGTMDAAEREYKNLKKVAKDLNDLRKLGQEIGEFGAGYTKLQAYVTGYGEGYLGDIVDGRLSLTIDVMFCVSGKHETTVYHLPCYISLGIKAKIDTNFKGNISYENRAFSTSGLKWSVEPSISILPSAGLGIQNKCEFVSISGEVTLGAELRFPENYVKAFLKGNVALRTYVDVNFAEFSKEWEKLEGTWVIYDSNAPSGGSNNGGYGGGGGGGTGFSLDKTTYMTVSQDFLADRPENLQSFCYEDEESSDRTGNPVTVSQNGLDSVSENKIEERSILVLEEDLKAETTAQLLPGGISEILPAAYPVAMPKLVHTTNGDYLFFIDSIVGRNAYNQTALMYMKTTDGVTWSTPARVDRMEDETADGMYDICVSGDKIYVAWINSNKEYADEFAENNSIVDYVAFKKNTDIMMAVIDTADDEIIAMSYQTDKGDELPNIAVHNGSIYTAWFENSLDSEDDANAISNKMSLVYTKTDSVGDMSDIVRYEFLQNQYPLSMDIGTFDGGMMAAVTVDTDQDLSTTDDWEIILINLSDRVSSELGIEPNSIYQITKNDTRDTLPVFAKLNGTDALYWRTDNNICYMTNGQETNSVLAGENNFYAGLMFYVLDDGQKTSIVWETPSPEENVNTTVVYAMDYLDGEWSNSYILAETNSEFTSSVNGYLSDGKPVLVYLSRQYNETSEEDICAVCMINPEDVIRTEVSYNIEESEARIGEPLPIHITVKNVGNTVLNNINVSVTGNEYINEKTDKNPFDGENGIYPGDSVEIEYLTQELTLPTELQLFETKLSVSTDGETPHIMDISFGQADLSLETEMERINGDDVVVVNVQNNGLLTTDAKVSLYTDSEYLEKADEFVLENIANGESVSQAVNLSKLDKKAKYFYLLVEDEQNNTALKEIHMEDNELTINTTYGKENNELGDTYYIVYFLCDSSNEKIPFQKVYDGDKVIKPMEPTRKGYRFAGWYTNTDMTFPFDFTQNISKDMVLYGKWEKDGSGNNMGNSILTNKVVSISISGISKKIAAGKSVQLTAEISPANATNKAVTWTSSNTKFATVNAGGKVSVKKAGVGKSVVITAKANDGSGVTATYKITIMKDAVKSIKLSAANKTVNAGKSVKVKATVKTTGKKVNKALKWTSSNTDYATVNKSGKVKTTKAGKGKTVTITAQATDGSGKKARIKIKIK